jgi:hypothetical protein
MIAECWIGDDEDAAETSFRNRRESPVHVATSGPLDVDRC